MCPAVDTKESIVEAVAEGGSGTTKIMSVSELGGNNCYAAGGCGMLWAGIAGARQSTVESLG